MRAYRVVIVAVDNEYVLMLSVPLTPIEISEVEGSNPG